MPSPDFPYRFPAPVLRQDGSFRFHYLPLPAEVAEALEAAGVRRVECTLNGHPVRRAVQGPRTGQPHLLLSQALLRTVGAALGDLVDVALRPDPDPDRVELGEELEAALEQDDEAAARFSAMTPGRQRSLASYVTSAKRAETRVKRALELAHKLRTHALYGDLHGDR